jgi:hypothetical protein
MLVKKSEIYSRGRDLSSKRRNEIQENASIIGMDLFQALSLRRQLIIWSPM